MMAEFLVRVEDKVNADVYLDAKCLKRGDVVVVCPDGWPWSDLEQKSSFWRIIKSPGMPMEQAETFVAPEPGDPIKNLMLRRRAFKLDIDALPQVTKDQLATGTVSLSQTDVMAVQVLKPALADPKVIG